MNFIIQQIMTYIRYNKLLQLLSLKMMLSN